MTNCLRWRNAIRFLFVTWLGAIAAAAMAQSGGLQGHAYLDANTNGHYDEEEPGFANVMLRGANVAWPFITFEMMSGDDGSFQKGNLEPGLYAVSALVPAGFELTEPMKGGVQYFEVQGGTVGQGDIGIGKPCTRIKTQKMLCLADGSGCFLWTFTLKNLSTFPISHIFFYPPPGVTFQSPNTVVPNYIPVGPPIPVGGSQTFTIKVCGIPPNTDFCVDMSIHAVNLADCCGTAACFTTPDCDCLQFTEESVVCNPDGSYTYNYCVQNLSPYAIKYILFAPDAGDVQMVPNAVVLPTPIGYGGTYCGSFTLPPGPGGRPYCFWIAMADRNFMMCCNKKHCIDLPNCGGCFDAPGVCSGEHPRYGDQSFNGFNSTVAVVTSDDLFGGSSSVVHILNLGGYQCNPPALGFNWSGQTPYVYEGPGNAWSKSKLGSVFGLTLDPQGNIYVAASSSFSNDTAGTVGTLGSGTRGGCIYKIPINTGIPQLFTSNALPNTQLSDGTYPALGNITFDYDHNQFFVTDMEDGKIYRVDMAGNWSAGQAFDPMTPDDGQPGFAPLGERLWGIQYHAGRVYYGVWLEDTGPGRQNPTLDNTIRSVAIDNTGAFVPSSDQLEVTMPAFANIYSNPVSDISFSPEGRMGVAEHGMMSDSGPWPHQARALEFRCENGQWKLWTGPDWNNYNGQDVFRIRTSSAGGIDYDYDPQCPGQQPQKGRRIWWTADCQQGSPGGGCDVYGIVGFPIDGGSSNDALYMDLNNDLTNQDKTLIGDVEIPCPHPGFNLGPNRFQIITGALEHGDLDSLMSGDNLCMMIHSDLDALTATAEFQTTGVPADLHLLGYRHEGHPNRGGLMQNIAWYDFTAARWKVRDTRMAKPTVEVIQMEEASVAKRYVGPNGLVRVRVSVFQINDDDPTGDGWSILVDQANWYGE